MTSDQDHLTPTEDLILEVLIARHRLGENLWTFDARHKRVIGSLADKGWVTPMHGMVENTVRASLTQAAIDKWVSDAYVPPIFKNLTTSTDYGVRRPGSATVMGPINETPSFIRDCIRMDTGSGDGLDGAVLVSRTHTFTDWKEVTDA